MLKYKIALFLLPALIFLGCSKDSIVNPDNNSNNGAIVLKIDKNNAPANIFTVTASLSREGFQTLTSNMNLQSDTSASIQFPQIPVGEWLLVVEAKDSLGDVKFRGETSVIIMEGIMTQVNLTLIPTSTGLGSIEIFVTWGSANNSPNPWIDFNNNPLFNSSIVGSAGHGQPVVYYDGTKYRLWFHELTSGGGAQIYYAESTNGSTWIRNSVPVIKKGNPGNWDSHSVQAGAVLYDDGIFKMYYFGYDNQYNAWKIGMAQSFDGINWIKYPNPVFHDSISLSYQNAVSGIVKHNNLYYMYYSKFNPHTINLATSVDGINWTQFNSNPVLTQTQNWEGNGVYEGSVIYDDNKFKMYYMNSSSGAFGYAESNDGKNWTKPLNQPIFKSINTHNSWAAIDIAYPYVVKTSTDHRIFYSGFTNSGYRIGFIKKNL